MNVRMIPCYTYEGSTNRAVPDCPGDLVPEDPARLHGPEIGTYCWLNGKNRIPCLVKVIERFYVWSPEMHDMVTGYHGIRHYEWSVIEEGPGKYRAIVVNDTDLIALAPEIARKVRAKYEVIER